MEYFLKIDNAPGDSADAAHKDWIDVLNCSWGLTQSLSASATGSGAGAGKAYFQDFRFTMLLNKASPTLVKYCASGIFLPEVRLAARKAPSQDDFFTIKLLDVIIAGIEESADGENVYQIVSLSYSKIEYAYAPVNSDGSVGTSIAVKWNVKESKAY